MNQGGNTETLAPADPSLLENQYVSGTSQAQTSLYHHPTTAGSEVVSWAAPMVDGGSSENGFLPNSAYHYNQHKHAPPSNDQDGLSATSVATSSSSFVAANGPQPQDYSYASYPNSTSTYGYGSTGYEGYYNTYQQQPNHPHTQPVSYQNTGAPYQPNSSFQNTGFYPGSSSYSTTYYTTGDYQTAGGYPSTSYPSGCYSNQATSGAYANYAPHQYANYSADSSGAYSSASATATSQHYQQQYQQWADYYSQTEVSCAPGTEKLSVACTSNLVGPTSGLAGGYSAVSSQPTASYLPTWRPESSSSGLTPVQLGVVTSDSTDDASWKPGAPNYQVNHAIITQPNFEKPLDLKNSYDSFQDHQKNLYPGGSNSQNLITRQGPQSHQPLSEIDSSSDTRRVSKVQIPTNPRIASNLTFGVPKSSVDSSMTNAAAKPAYISVSMPTPNDKIQSKDTTESMWKPAMFPKSLRGYVERALAQCKDETQMTSCQSILKEMITNATGDGTLYTRNWDIEPMFQLQNADTADTNNSEISSHLSVLPKYKRSPTRKFKSRWEPLSEVKGTVEQTPGDVTTHNFKDGDWVNINGRDKKTLGWNSQSKSVNNSRFPSWDQNQKTDSKMIKRKFKKQRLVDGSDGTDTCAASSDSDKEQNLTGYFTGVVALADTPEEQMRRENRSKRFEKGRGPQADKRGSKHKNAGNTIARRTSALILSKNLDECGSRAVEDIDWDSLTVKGTCQEIEKRYLRLTSAPDPACVRPEVVLDRALHMVQNSEKNYLYKCDQLKSIRQDLTVQRIRNQLTVKVYETHARLALEFGDLPEYNQCQSQLKILYAEGIQGCHMEFAAYNLLCVILHSNNNRDLLSQMSRLSEEAKANEMVKHARAVRAAVTSGNYVTFFRLYKAASNISTCLMDLYVEKMRYKAINCITRSYRPTAPVSYVAQVLGFTNVIPIAEGTDKKDSDGLEECVEWLKAHGAHLVTDNNGEMQLDAKASSSSLHMPEPEDAVPHGDSNLAVNDFLTRAHT